MVAYYFPPDSSSGSMRPFYWANYLSRSGWDVSVLTVKKKKFLPEQPVDIELAKGIQPGVHVVRTNILRPRNNLLSLKDLLFNLKINPFSDSIKPQDRTPSINSQDHSLFREIKDILTEILASPDQHIGWLPFAVVRGLRIIKKNRIDLVYATGSPWTCLLIGTILKWLTGCPLILDFRDPWVSNPVFLVRPVLLRKLETFMEQHVVHIADGIIANTEELKTNFLHRYKFLSSDLATCITNGFDAYQDSKRVSKNWPKKLIFTHAGSLYFSRNPKNILLALKKLLDSGKILEREIQFIFLGGIEVNDPDISDLLAAPELKTCVEILPRVPHTKVSTYLRESDILFLIQLDFPLQVPRKLFDYIAARKPILAITDIEGASAHLMQKYNLGVVVNNQVDDIASAIYSFYQKWKDASLPRLAREDCDHFLNRNLAGKLKTFLQKVVFANEFVQ
ncbi:MAG: hypothetical protein B1H11_07980 [Desulfobacteraceae bacterium 4484_190.1]|nr:MAG: hypothetical protein B1H11_07980 [Desulfobacteraceae bacterium 4484_190.1]